MQPGRQWFIQVHRLLAVASHVRAFSVPADAKTFVMPKLSPKMTKGRVSKWYCNEGDLVKTHDLICEISTKELMDEAQKTERISGDEQTMEIEAQEDLYIAKEFITDSNKVVPVGTPLAVTCEEQSTMPSLKDMTPESASKLVTPERYFTYQAYIKPSSAPPPGDPNLDKHG